MQKLKADLSQFKKFRSTTQHQLFFSLFLSLITHTLTHYALSLSISSCFSLTPFQRHTHTHACPSIPLVISPCLPWGLCNTICLRHSLVPSRQLGLQRFLPLSLLLPFSLHRDQKLNMTATPESQKRMSNSSNPT